MDPEQRRVEQIANQTADLLNDYNTVSKVVDGLVTYNTLLQRQIDNQEAEKTALNESIKNVALIERQIIPLMTRMLMASSRFFVTYWPGLLIGMLAGIFAFRAWVASPRGTLIWSGFLLRAPLFGDIVRKAVLGRFSQSMALTIRSGVPLIHALTVVAGVVDNPYVGEKIQSMRSGIEKGDTVSRTAAGTGLFTPLVLQMLAVGEGQAEWNVIMASAMLAMIPPVLVVIFMQKQFVKGMTETEK